MDQASPALDWIKPDRNGSLPLQVQVTRWLESSLAAGRLRAGDRLPAEAEMVARLGVSRVTVRLAVDDLVARGLVVRSHGRGSFVRGAPFRHDLLAQQGFFDALLSEAAEPGARLLTWRQDEPPEAVARLFGLGPRERLPRFERLYLSAGHPVGLSCGWLPTDARDLRREDVEARSTATVHADMLGRPVVKSSTEVSAAEAGARISRLLQIETRRAVLVLTRSRFDADGALRDHSRFTLNPAAYRLTLATAVGQSGSAILEASTV